MSTPFSRLRIEETHQLPNPLRRISGDAGLVLVGLLAWFALPLHGLAFAGYAAATAGLLLASVLLLSGRNARLVRARRGPA